MKNLAIILSIGIATALSLYAADRKSSDDVFSLQYVKAVDAFRLLKEVDPDYASAVNSVSSRLNLITLDPRHAKLNDIRKILVEIDQRPQQIVHRAVLSEIVGTGNDRKERIISRPTVYTIKR